jgi:hypothetical protein
MAAALSAAGRDQLVLDKHKNEYFNYPEPVQGVDGEPDIDEEGEPRMTSVRNHFASPKKPYVFLSIFSLQERPHDITGLIEQNIPNQNKVSRRTEQIDINVSKSNNFTSNGKKLYDFNAILRYHLAQ